SSTGLHGNYDLHALIGWSVALAVSIVYAGVVGLGVGAFAGILCLLVPFWGWYAWAAFAHAGAHERMGGTGLRFITVEGLAARMREVSGEGSTKARMQGRVLSPPAERLFLGQGFEWRETQAKRAWEILN